MPQHMEGASSRGVQYCGGIFWCKTWLAALLCCITSSSVWGLINTDIQRTIDLRTSVARVSMTIRAQGVNGDYAISFPSVLAENLAYLSITQDGSTLPYSPPQQTTNYTLYSVNPSGSSVVLKVKAVFTESLAPYPKEIGQNDNQFVVYSDNAYVSSPYTTNSQQTTVKLASSNIESYSRVEPSVWKRDTVVYGPYTQIPAYQFQQLRVHFLNNKKFARLSSSIREMEVSHWGNIAVEEVYELQHAGAKLKEGFSRFEYQMRRGAEGPSFRTVRAYLPAKSENVYYRDQIGNISTSDMRWEDDTLELELSTRFPLFGGWKTQFYIGYSVPTTLWLFKNETSYNLRFDFFVPFEDVWVTDMTLKVVLPEGATDVTTEVPYNVTIDTARRFTYLDSSFMGGRPVIIIKMANLVEEHTGMVHISYKYNQRAMVVKPLLVVGAFLVFYLVCIVAARIQLSFSGTPSKTVA